MRLAETIIALALQTLVLADLVAGLAATLAAFRGGLALHDRLAHVRQIEHLLDRAVSAAGQGPSAPAAIGQASAFRLVLQTDLDGDRFVSSDNAERISFELAAGPLSSLRLLHRVGRQAMAIDAGLRDAARFRYADAYGHPTIQPQAIRLIRVPLAEGTLSAALYRDGSRAR